MNTNKTQILEAGKNTRFKKGHTQSAESRHKMSLAKLGKTPPNKKPDAFITCNYCGILKKVKPVYLSTQKYCSKQCANKGADKGKTSTIKKLRTSKEYSLWRTSVFERDNYTCVWCGVKSRKGHPVTLNADHIKPFAHFPELRFAIDNGRTLCVPCHKKTGTYGRGAIYRKLTIANA